MIRTRLIEAKNRARRQGWLRWLRQGAGEEADEKALLNGCFFDERRGQHAVDFIDRYGTLTEGPWKGKPFTLQTWQHDATMRAFGWQRPSPEWACNVRRFRYWYLEVPKKNGKTPFLSVLGNYLLFGDSFGRQVNVYLAATTRKQAERCLLHAIRQVRNNPELEAAAEIRKLEGFHQITYGDNEWQVLAADPESADGVNGHCLADELHRWRGFEFFNTLRWMLASQPEGLFIGITTAGSNPDSVCRTLHDKTREINEGRQVDEAFYGEIFAADKNDDPHDEETWRKANPSLGDDAAAPIKLSTFRADYEAARDDPTQWPAFLQLRLNLWRTSEDNWCDLAFPRGIADWDAGEAERRAAPGQRVDCFEPYTAEDLDRLKCLGAAFDGAAIRDTTCLQLVFGSEDESPIDRIPYVWPIFWLPRRRAEQLGDTVSYRRWADAGHLILTEGDAIDFRAVLAGIVAAFNRWRPPRFYFDPLFQAEWLTQEIEAATGVERVEFPQTITHFAGPAAALERMIVEHKIRHPGHPLLTWQIGNTRMRTDANGNRRPIKPPTGEHKTIDGVVALIMAIRDAVGAVDPPNFYEENDPEWI